MTPNQALEEIAHICITSNPVEGGVLDDIQELLKKYCPIEYAAAKSKFDIETRIAIENFEQLDPSIRKAVLDYFGR